MPWPGAHEGGRTKRGEKRRRLTASGSFLLLPSSSFFLPFSLKKKTVPHNSDGIITGWPSLGPFGSSQKLLFKCHPLLSDSVSDIIVDLSCWDFNIFNGWSRCWIGCSSYAAPTGSRRRAGNWDYSRKFSQKVVKVRPDNVGLWTDHHRVEHYIKVLRVVVHVSFSFRSFG